MGDGTEYGADETQGYWYTDDCGNTLVGYEPRNMFTSVLDTELIDEPGSIVQEADGSYLIHGYEKESALEILIRFTLDFTGIDYVRQFEYQHEDGYLAHADFALIRGRPLIIEVNGDDVHCLPSKHSATYINPYGKLAADVWAIDASRARSLEKLGYTNQLTIWGHEINKSLLDCFITIRYCHTSFTDRNSFTSSFFCNCGVDT